MRRAHEGGAGQSGGLLGIVLPHTPTDEHDLPGDAVNLEVDILAKYVESLLAR